MPVEIIDNGSASPTAFRWPNFLSTGDDKRSSVKIIYDAVIIGGTDARLFEVHYSSSGDISVRANFWQEEEQEEEVDPSEAQFRQQRDAFIRRSVSEPLFLAPYQGLFVVSQDGQIVDSDVSLNALTARFFAKHGDMPVYATRIGGVTEERIETPFYD